MIERKREEGAGDWRKSAQRGTSWFVLHNKYWAIEKDRSVARRNSFCEKRVMEIAFILTSSATHAVFNVNTVCSPANI